MRHTPILPTLTFLALFISVPSSAQTDKPISTEKQYVVGFNLSPDGSLLRREPGGKRWLPIAQKGAIYTGDLLLGLPSAVIQLKNGMRLELDNDIEQTSPFPIVETAVRLHDSDMFDLDFTMERGRAIVVNGEKVKTKVRVRFPFRIDKDQHWELTLLEPGTRVGFEIFGRWQKGDEFKVEPGAGYAPLIDVIMVVLKGRVQLSTDEHQFHMKAPPGPAFIEWDSRHGLDELPRTMKQLPPWAQKTDLTSPEAKEKIQILEKFRKLVVTKSPGVALDTFIHSKNPRERRLAIFAMAAMDDLDRLADTLIESEDFDTWDAAVLALRHWIGRGPGQDQKLYHGLLEAGLPKVEAAIIMQLLHSFSDFDLNCPECYDVLVEYLRHPRRAIRGLAYWHLRRLVPAGKNIPFKLDGTKEEINRMYTAWRKLIPEGKLPQKKAKNDSEK
ncbi:MAG: hypothetical protein KatS3mg105_2456 [Gemmatales bacterium]|nr:MAG: hypothetical protein KatS3mg105_2456 [Gemmatales bacterium]